MTKTTYGTELISEGCRSYHKALFAVMQFRKHVQTVIRTAVDDHATDLAAALGLAESEIQCADYADPSHYQVAFDGSEAEVGLKCEYENWALYYYVWVGDEGSSFFGAQCWLKNPGSVIAKLASSGGEDLEVGENYVELPAYLRTKAWTSSRLAIRSFAVGSSFGPRSGGCSSFCPNRKRRRPLRNRPMHYRA
jgi:hypothetical protein